MHKLTLIWNLMGFVGIFSTFPTDNFYLRFTLCSALLLSVTCWLHSAWTLLCQHRFVYIFSSFEVHFKCQSHSRSFSDLHRCIKVLLLRLLLYHEHSVARRNYTHNVTIWLPLPLLIPQCVLIKNIFKWIAGGRAHWHAKLNRSPIFSQLTLKSDGYIVWWYKIVHWDEIH